MRAGSLTARLSLLFALSTAAVLFALGTTLEYAVERHFRDMDRHDLTGKLALVREMVASVVDGAAPVDLAADLPADLTARLDASLVGHPDLIVQLRDADGAPLFTRGNLPAETDSPGWSAPARASAAQWLQWQHDGRPFRGLRAPLHEVTKGTETKTAAGSVLIGMDIGHHQAFMEVFRRILALTILAAASTAAVLGWAVTRAGLRPLRRMTALAAALDTERLDARLPRAGVPAEIQALVDAFNSMLGRLDDSFRRLSEFSADVAHELRTPIANLTLQAQIALNEHRDADAYREVLYAGLDEYERLTRLINDMLYLARADRGLLRPAQERVDLAVEIDALFEFFDAWAEERGIALVLDGQAATLGDATMLRRACANLIANAIRHTPAGARVRVLLWQQAAQAGIAVENPGPPIPSAQRARLFERFYRADPARQRDPGEAGAGLGLAIVKAIVELHAGTVAAESDDGVVRFVVRLPICSAR
ncbi:MAG: heavy metal sensor histidine kinase [Chromatiaceae bacterium]|jgi:two-component system heavy metal sensor histidine kinase CusS|nr:heavy metal sensor histidine kinase [Chromatiaceae bacterium]MCF8017465.1 heavy metal sensor histidine kinase [Chromatiaceae bacterium]